MPPVRLSVSLSGGAALGAYQAGAMAALLVAVERIRDEEPDAVVLEAVGGASAGALVGLLAATSHLCGLDPVATMRGAWVEEVDLDLLLDHTGGAPLGPDGLRQRLEGFLLEAEPVREPSADTPIVLTTALSGLRGLTYHVEGLRGPDSIPASTYADWVRTTLSPGLDRHELSTPPDASPIDAAIASAANPGVFPPQQLDRSRDAQAYRDHGIEDLPDHGRLWFTDGGLMQMEPVGRLLAASREVHGDVGDARRLVLLVDPRSEGPSTGRRFGDPEHEPGWVEALSRALSILPAQILYDDLRRISRDNDRLAEADALADRIEQAVPEGGRDDLASALQQFLGADDGAAPGKDRLGALLRAAIGEAAGTEGKQHVDVDVLTPLLLLGGDEDREGLQDLLAGDALGDLGGFLDETLRDSDFVLGYATTLTWLRDGLPALGLSDHLTDAAVTAVRDAHTHDWRAANAGRTQVEDLPRTARLQLLELAASAAFGMVAEAVGAMPRLERASDLAAAARDVVRGAIGRNE